MYELRVYYEDTDAGGIVYHANYLKFCERARSEMLYQKGLSPIVDGNHFVMTQMQAKFRRPAKLGDILYVYTELVQLRNVSIELHQKVFLEEAVLYEQTGSFALVNSEGKPVRLSEKAKALFL